MNAEEINEVHEKLRNAYATNKDNRYSFHMNGMWGFDSRTDEAIIAMGISAGTYWETIDRALTCLRERRDELEYSVALEGAHENLGIYPQNVITGDGETIERSEWQEGWNACIKAYHKNLCAILDNLKEIPDEIIEMVYDDRVHISARSDDNSVTLYVICNDLFWWACSDMEEFDLSELPDLQKALEESPTHGDLLWVCRKRGMRPQKPYYKYFKEEEKHLFDACGDERDV